MTTQLQSPQQVRPRHCEVCGVAERVSFTQRCGIGILNPLRVSSLTEELLCSKCSDDREAAYRKRQRETDIPTLIALLKQLPQRN